MGESVIFSRFLKATGFHRNALAPERVVKVRGKVTVGKLGYFVCLTRKAFFFDTRVLCEHLRRVLSIALRNQTVGLDLHFLFSSNT